MSSSSDRPQWCWVIAAISLMSLVILLSLLNLGELKELNNPAIIKVAINENRLDSYIFKKKPKTFFLKPIDITKQNMINLDVFLPLNVNYFTAKLYFNHSFNLNKLLNISIDSKSYALYYSVISFDMKISPMTNDIEYKPIKNSQITIIQKTIRNLSDPPYTIVTGFFDFIFVFLIIVCIIILILSLCIIMN